MLALLKIGYLWLVGNLTLAVVVSAVVVLSVGGLIFLATIPSVGGPVMDSEDNISPENEQQVVQLDELSDQETIDSESQDENFPDSIESVDIPSVEGMEATEARGLITSLGLRYVFETPSESCLKGEREEGYYEALYTEPRAGASVYVGTPIGLYICWVSTAEKEPTVVIVQPEEPVIVTIQPGTFDNKYFPVRLGAIWKYRVEPLNSWDNTHSLEITELSNSVGTGLWLWPSSDGTYHSLNPTLENRSDGLQLGYLGVDILPHELALGLEWTYESSNYSQQARAASSMTTITVPAGVFEAICITYTSSWVSVSNPNAYWPFSGTACYVEGVGLILEEVHSMRPNDEDVRIRTWELIDYSIPNK